MVEQLFDIHHGGDVDTCTWWRSARWTVGSQRRLRVHRPFLERGNRKSRRLRSPYSHVWRRSLARLPTCVDGGRGPTGAALEHGRSRRAGSLCRPQRPCYAAIFSPDGRRILSGDANGEVRLWDTKTAQELHCYRGHTKPISRFAFSPDGRYGLSSGEDGVRLLGLPPQDPCPHHECPGFHPIPAAEPILRPRLELFRASSLPGFTKVLRRCIVTGICRLAVV